MTGVFDSGVGGLSVWREMVNRMPNERFLYVADSGFCPYGPKPREEIIERAVRITEYLIAKGANRIVIACNTATGAAIDHLRAHYSIPFVGMEPAVKPAALNTHTGVIGVLATKGTFKGELYLRTLHKFAANATVIEQIGEGLVEAVEAGEIEAPQTIALLKQYLLPMMAKRVDHLVLGCTHYPFLIEPIRSIVGDQMIIVNPAPAVAKRVYDISSQAERATQEQGLTLKPCEFITTGNNTALIKQMVHAIVPNHSAEYIYKREKI